VRHASNGEEGMAMMRQCVPDLLITHLELPGMDGLAMLHTLERCEQAAAMRILALSPLDEREVVRRGGLPARAELIQMPVSAEAVAVRVGRWLLSQRVSEQS